MNNKLDLKIKAAGHNNVKKTVILISLSVSIFLLLFLFFYAFLNDVVFEQIEKISANSPTTTGDKTQQDNAENFTSKIAPQFLYKTEVKDKLVMIVGENDNNNIFSKRAIDLLGQLNQLEKESWKDEAKAHMLIEEALVLINRSVQLRTGYEQALDAAYERRDLPAFQSNLKSLKKISEAKRVEQSRASQLMRLEKINSFMEKAKNARGLNDVENELDALMEIKKLVKLTPIEDNRIQLLRKKYKENKYRDYVKKANNYLKQRQYQLAKTEAASASAIFPERQELLTLLAKIELSIKGQQFDFALLQAEQFIAADQWLEAEEKFEIALEIFPTNDSTLNRLALARKINSLVKELNIVLESPIKLSDSNVRAYALNLIKRNSESIAQSAKLYDLAEKVGQLLEDAIKPREVKIISDNKARIEIKGTGFISPNFMKTIFLYPGIYKLVAKCKGHRDKLLNVTIPLYEKEIEVRIGCGEQI